MYSVVNEIRDNESVHCRTLAARERRVVNIGRSEGVGGDEDQVRFSSCGGDRSGPRSKIRSMAYSQHGEVHMKARIVA